LGVFGDILGFGKKKNWVFDEVGSGKGVFGRYFNLIRILSWGNGDQVSFILVEGKLGTFIYGIEQDAIWLALQLR